jgi:hypothetical protein
VNGSRVKQWVTENTGWLLIVAALVFGGVYAAEVRSEHVHARQQAALAEEFARKTACQAEYNKAFATQLTERSRLSSATSDAQTHILSEIGKAIAAPPTKDKKVQAKRTKDFLNLFVQFDKNTNLIAAERAATPLPPIPDCG